MKTKDTILKEAMQELVEFLHYVYCNIRFERDGVVYALSQLYPEGGSIEGFKRKKKAITITKTKYQAPTLKPKGNSEYNHEFTEHDMVLNQSDINDHLYKCLLNIFEKEENRNPNNYGIGCRLKGLKNVSNQDNLPRFKELTKREIYLVAMISFILRYYVYYDFHSGFVRFSYETQTEHFFPKRVNYVQKKEPDHVFLRKKYRLQLSGVSRILSYIHYEITLSEDEIPWIQGGILIFDDFFSLKYKNTLHIIFQLFLSYLYENDTAKVKFCCLPHCGKLFVERRQNRGKFCSAACRKANHKHLQSDKEKMKTKCRLRQRSYITDKLNKQGQIPYHVIKDDCINCKEYDFKGGKCWVLKSKNKDYFYLKKN